MSTLRRVDMASRRRAERRDRWIWKAATVGLSLYMLGDLVAGRVAMPQALVNYAVIAAAVGVIVHSLGRRAFTLVQKWRIGSRRTTS